MSRSIIEPGTQILDYGGNRYTVVAERVKDKGFARHSQYSNTEYAVVRHSDGVTRWVADKTVRCFLFWQP